MFWFAGSWKEHGVAFDHVRDALVLPDGDQPSISA